MQLMWWITLWISIEWLGNKRRIYPRPFFYPESIPLSYKPYSGFMQTLKYCLHIALLPCPQQWACVNHYHYSYIPTLIKTLKRLFCRWIGRRDCFFARCTLINLKWSIERRAQLKTFCPWRFHCMFRCIKGAYLCPPVDNSENIGWISWG
jgi:hypothetical protein